MKYRVYYSENVYTAKSIEADGPREAAVKFFNLSPRDYKGNISVEEKGIGRNGFFKYPLSEFVSNLPPSEAQKVNSLAVPKVEQKFHTVRGITKYLTFLGWLNILISIALFFWAILSLQSSGFALIVYAFGSFMIGVLILGLGELLLSIISIEENTRITNELLGRSINKE